MPAKHKAGRRKRYPPLIKAQVNVRHHFNAFLDIMEPAFNELTPASFYELENEIIHQINVSRAERRSKEGGSRK